MNTWKLSLLSLAAGTLIAAATQKSNDLQIGDAAPLANQELLNIDNTKHTLKSLAKDNGLLVIFSCNTCPYVIGWEDTYPELGTLTAENTIGMALINSNEAFRDGVDSQQKMIEHAQEANYNTPYLIDKKHKVADAFGAQTTPHVFLFDKNLKLIYKGSINDKYENKEKEATQHYLRDAITAHVNNKPIETTTTRQIGCSIKRVKK
ncbi:MAG: thioredoxin family protein [Schleiferiaceae bacterium]|nr:thioredoxin family protein [Schleiferiaceae bacterium]